MTGPTRMRRLGAIAAGLAAVGLLAAARQQQGQGRPRIDRAAIFIVPAGGGSQGFSVTRDGALRGFRSSPGLPARYARGRLDSLALDSLLRLWDRIQDSLPGTGSGGGAGFIRVQLDLSNGRGWIDAWPDTAAIEYPRIQDLVRFMYQHRVGGW